MLAKVAAVVVSDVHKTEHPLAWKLLLVFRSLILLASIVTQSSLFFFITVFTAPQNLHASTFSSPFTLLGMIFTLLGMLLFQLVGVICVQVFFAIILAPLWILPARLFSFRGMYKVECAALVLSVVINLYFVVRT